MGYTTECVRHRVQHITKQHILYQLAADTDQSNYFAAAGLAARVWCYAVHWCSSTTSLLRIVEMIQQHEYE